MEDEGLYSYVVGCRGCLHQIQSQLTPDLFLDHVVRLRRVYDVLYNVRPTEVWREDNGLWVPLTGENTAAALFPLPVEPYTRDERMIEMKNYQSELKAIGERAVVTYAFSVGPRNQRNRNRGKINLAPQVGVHVVDCLTTIVSSLGESEQKLFRLRVKGCHHEKIAQELYVSPSTVYRHLNQLYVSIGYEICLRHASLVELLFPSGLLA